MKNFIVLTTLSTALLLCYDISAKEVSALELMQKEIQTRLKVDAHALLFGGLTQRGEVLTEAPDFESASHLLWQLSKYNANLSCGISSLVESNQRDAIRMTIMGTRADGTTVYLPKENFIDRDSRIYSIQQAQGTYDMRTFPIPYHFCSGYPASNEEIDGTYRVLIIDRYVRWAEPAKEPDTIRRVKVYYSTDLNGKKVLLGISEQLMGYEKPSSLGGLFSSPAFKIKSSVSCRAYVRDGGVICSG